MLDGLLKSKFYSKCKSDIRRTRARIEMIKKKRNAMQKYLKNDVADLLKNKLDDNAYGRAEGLVIELNRSSCFEQIEQFCAQIANNFRTMDKQMDCPKDCREEVSSLMFAAARFAELPELRGLRSIFSERYSNALDFYVNKQFMEKLKSGHPFPSKEMKLQLLHDIAAEFGIEWNSKALETKLYNDESACEKDLRDEFRVKVYVSRYSTDGLVLMNEFKGRTEYRRNDLRKCISPDRKDRLKCRIEERLPLKTENVVLRKDVSIKGIRMDTIRRSENHNELESRDDPNAVKYRSTPPYLKSNVSTVSKDQDEAVDKSKQVPTSIRKKELKTQPAHVNSIDYESQKSKEDNNNKEEAVEQGRRVLKFLDRGSPDQRDEEEKTMDRLLQYYSRKKASCENGDIKLASDHGKRDTDRIIMTKVHRSRDGPTRAASLPGILLYSPIEETPIRYARASSFQPEAETLNGKGHVHPKLPDYDDFVARLAALRGNKK